MIAFSWLELSKKSFFETVFNLAFGIAAFSRRFLTGVLLKLYAESKGAPAIAYTAKVSGAGVTNNSALCRVLYDYALLSMSAADLIFSGLTNGMLTFPHYRVSFHFREATKLKSCRHLAACIRLSTTHETLRRRLHKVPTIPLPWMCLRLQVWKIKSLY